MPDSVNPSTTSQVRDARQPPGQDGLVAVLEGNRDVLQRFLARRMGNETEAEDVLQDVWIRLNEKPVKGPIADPLAYLFRIAENAARDYRRSEGRRHAREGHWAEGHGHDSSDAQLQTSPERQAIVRDELRQVEAQLMKLPERTRAIFVAFRLEGVPYKQIAADLGISLSAVQKHLQRAYRAVVDPIARDEDGGEEFSSPDDGKDDR